MYLFWNDFFFSRNAMICWLVGAYSQGNRFSGIHVVPDWRIELIAGGSWERGLTGIPRANLLGSRASINCINNLRRNVP